MTRLKMALGFCVIASQWAIADPLPLNLAEGLLQQGRYKEAELEFERMAYLERGKPAERTAVEKALASASATDDANFLLRVSRTWKGRPELHCIPELYEGYALYRLNNMSDVLEGDLPAVCPLDLRDEYRYLEGLSLMQLDRGSEAAVRFNEISASSLLRPKSEDAARAALQPPSWKKPRTAAMLNAVLPGAGYGYAGRPQTAAAAFLVTGLTVWGAYAAAHAGEPGLAAVASLLSFGWYTGGVYGGGTAAEHENSRRRTAWIGPFELHR
jgi:hypothetical protein